MKKSSRAERDRVPPERRSVSPGAKRRARPAAAPCWRRSEWFLPGTELEQTPVKAANDYAWVQWYLDGEWIASGDEPFFLWLLQGGPHRLSARVGLKHTRTPIETESVRFLVK
ncbi:MAG: hypothetical protein ACREYE_13175 [Gammaproteobacteria bacterium]